MWASEEKNLTPRDEMKIYETKDSECVTKGTTETNMQDVPSAAVTVSAGTHHSLPKSAELHSVPLLRARVSDCHGHLSGFYTPYQRLFIQI